MLKSIIGFLITVFRFLCKIWKIYVQQPELYERGVSLVKPKKCPKVTVIYNQKLVDFHYNRIGKISSPYMSKQSLKQSLITHQNFDYEAQKLIYVKCQLQRIMEKENFDTFCNASCTNTHLRDEVVLPFSSNVFVVEGIKKNIVAGEYATVEDYLSTQLKLLREDCFESIRNGLVRYRENNSLINDDLLFFKAKFVGLLLDNPEVSYLIRFSPLSSKSNEKFLFGSLLLFTVDDFKTYFLASVNECEYNVFPSGYTSIALPDLDIYRYRNIYNYEFLMAKPNMFFYQYHLSMKVLKERCVSTMPFSKVILGKSVTKSIPPYLKNISQCEIFGKLINFWDETTWPSAEAIGFNNSQMESFLESLKVDFSIIQGPPGTGKSYTGLKIVEALIAVHDCLKMKSPILVITLTNHALDQFLELVLEKTEKVVRLGMQCESSKVKPYMLCNLSEKFPKSADIKSLRTEIKSLSTSCGVSIERFLSQESISFNEMSSLCSFNTYADQLHEDYTFYKNYRTVQQLSPKVIGLTTTGAARHMKWITGLNPKVCVIDEAGKLLEPLVVSSLPKTCQQVILIGDHKQLRPSPNSYNLANEKKFNVSLFERLVNNGMPVKTLRVQHRMREEICDLLVPQIYRKLIPHSSVKTFPNVKGMERNLAFMDHDYEEEVSGNSFYNSYEVKFAVGLCVYLSRFHPPSSITVVTNYSEQKRRILENLKEFSLDGVEVDTVDGYQGEENEVVILSTVRSNKEGRVGFSGQMSRVNVALSRAKHGLYIIGNMSCLERRSYLWQTVKHKLERTLSIGKTLGLKCPKHSAIYKVSGPEDFNNIRHDCLPSCYEDNHNTKNIKKANKPRHRRPHMLDL